MVTSSRSSSLPRFSDTRMSAESPDVPRSLQVISNSGVTSSCRRPRSMAARPPPVWFAFADARQEPTPARSRRPPGADARHGSDRRDYRRHHVYDHTRQVHGKAPYSRRRRRSDPHGGLAGCGFGIAGGTPPVVVSGFCLGGLVAAWSGVLSGVSRHLGLRSWPPLAGPPSVPEVDQVAEPVPPVCSRRRELITVLGDGLAAFLRDIVREGAKGHPVVVIPVGD